MKTTYLKRQNKGYHSYQEPFEQFQQKLEWFKNRVQQILPDFSIEEIINIYNSWEQFEKVLGIVDHQKYMEFLEYEIFKYYKHEELSQFLNQEVEFIVDDKDSPRRGIVTFEGKDYFLPYCGKVKAHTVKIRPVV